MRTGVALLGVCITALAISGCSFQNGFVYEKISGEQKRVGEYRDFDFGAEVALYRTDGGRRYNFPTSQVLLDIFRGHLRQGDSSLQASAKTLKVLRDRCPRVGVAARGCQLATAPYRAGEFLRDSLGPATFSAGACIAWRGPISGAGDWTYRSGSFPVCRPN